MSEQNQTNPPESTPAYQRLLHRVRDSWEQLEQKTVDGIRHEIDQAIELEEAAEEMTREELDLLGAYLKRDIESLSQFVAQTGKGVADWLKFDIHLLEDRLAALLLSVADQTTVEQRALSQQMQSAEPLYVAGETVMAGTFACTNCGDVYVFTTPGRLENCIECSGDAYTRKSAD